MLNVFNESNWALFVCYAHYYHHNNDYDSEWRGCLGEHKTTTKKREVNK